MNLIRNPVANELVPTEFSLGQNYPNPFMERTTIKYCVAYKTNVKLTVYDSESEVIKILVDEEKNPGTYELEFSSHSGGVRNLPSGVYFYRLQANSFVETKKMLLVK